MHTSHHQSYHSGMYSAHASPISPAFLVFLLVSTSTSTCINGLDYFHLDTSPVQFYASQKNAWKYLELQFEVIYGNDCTPKIMSHVVCVYSGCLEEEKKNSSKHPPSYVFYDSHVDEKLKVEMLICG